MRVLVACEYSGVVRDAFAARGHDAWSCDILPTERAGNHIQGDALAILKEGWDLMVAHPPCTYLSYAGIGYFNEPKYGDKARERKAKRELAKDFFLALWNAYIPRIAIENPRGYMQKFIKPTQLVQPYYFGDAHVKLTYLWLRGLPPLIHYKQSDLINDRGHTDKPRPISISPDGHPRYFTDATTGKDRQKLRSKTFAGIATAMAEQWGDL